MKTSKFLMLTVFFLHQGVNAMAQANGADDNFKALHTNGKIYVVVAVVAIIFLGIVVYLFSLERKVKKLENLLKNK